VQDLRLGEHIGAPSIDLAETVEVGGIRPERAYQGSYESVLVGERYQWVGCSLAPDGTGPLSSQARRAEGASTMGRPHRHLVTQLHQSSQGVELGTGELVGAVECDQVSARRRADDQRPSGEDSDWLVAIQEQEAQMLVGVPRCRHRAQPQAAEINFVAIAHPAVDEATLTRGRGENLCVLSRGKLTGTGQEVGVQVGVCGECNAQPQLVGCGTKAAQIPTGVHRQPATVPQIDQVGTVAQPRVDQGMHEVASHAASPRFVILRTNA